MPRRRVTVVIVAAVTVTAVVIGVVAAGRRGHGNAASATGTTATGIATVKRTDLVNREQVNGTLGYAAAPTPLVSARAGVVTALADEGAVVERGRPLFAVDATPVVLLIGTTPMYRDLVEGMAGADVRELKENLVALGYATWTSIGDDDRFTAATVPALRALQAAIGTDPTGIVADGDVVFLPGAVRIGTHKVTVGATVAAGAPVTELSAVTRIVTVKLDATKQESVKVGDQVVVELPSGATTPGTVSVIARVAKTDNSGGGGSAPGGAATPTVDLTVALSDPSATGAVDQAPVKVDITTGHADHVLAVPVSALVALAEGGYGVEVVSPDGAHRLVGVTTGMFSDADDLVEVRGDLRPGDKVVVAR